MGAVIGGGIGSLFAICYQLQCCRAHIAFDMEFEVTISRPQHAGLLTVQMVPRLSTFTGEELEGLRIFRYLVPMWYPYAITDQADNPVSCLESMVSREGIEPSTY